MSARRKLAVATTSELAAAAAAEVADAGGNAVDCAVAAALVTMNTEPGVCALAGGAYITIWPSGRDPLTIDGGTAVPGLAAPDAADIAADSVRMDYGGGVETIVGGASVAVPGSVAACDRAIQRYGNVSWATVMAPSVRVTRDGFPLPAACHHYLEYSGTPIFGRSQDGFNALHDTSGRLRNAGNTITVAHLADSLAHIAKNGARDFYEGDLAACMVAHVSAGGGRLTAEDLQRYEAIERPALVAPFRGFDLALNPPPAIGGAMLAAMLGGLDRATELDRTTRLIRAQRDAMRFRLEHLDLAENVSDAITSLLRGVGVRPPAPAERSSATVHTSAVDSTGLACSVTSSAGYGSGEMPEGTGLWLNNCLGELELNRRGLDAGPPGARLPSNMTPGAARSADRIVAFGSPGADRITTALQQFIFNYLDQEMSLDAANSAGRVHVELRGESYAVSAEAGVSLDADVEVFRYPEHSMYFGGVGAAVFSAKDGPSASADPRRVGGTFVTR
ncbi:MAG: gamma-glutamyltransferase [Pseudomonadota bacterium]